MVFDFNSIGFEIQFHWFSNLIPLELKVEVGDIIFPDDCTIFGEPVCIHM